MRKHEKIEMLQTGEERTGRQFSISKSPTSYNCKPLAAILESKL